jgi:hypothetical protein
MAVPKVLAIVSWSLSSARAVSTPAPVATPAALIESANARNLSRLGMQQRVSRSRLLLVLLQSPDAEEQTGEK